MPKSSATLSPLIRSGTIRVYIDDSGKRDHSPVQVLAGYLASEAGWSAFDAEWKLLLDRHALEGLHMAEAWRLARSYHHLGKLRRDALLVEAIEIVKRHAKFAIVSSLHFEAFDHWFAREESDGHHALRPYFFAFHSLIVQVVRYVHSQRRERTIEFTFDEQGGESHRAVLSAMDQLRELCAKDFPGVEIVDPVFADDRTCQPLQAADLLAWLVRRDAYNAVQGIDRSNAPEALFLDEAISMHTHFQMWNDDNLEPASRLAAENIRRALRQQQAD